MDTELLYRQIASHYLLAIQAGTIAVGERMPSLRVLMARHGVSLSTALEACRFLEARGVLEARPRAGYFVRPPARPAMARAVEPVPCLPDPAQYVGLHERVSGIIARGRVPDLGANLALACGAPELYPTQALREATQRALEARINISADEIIVTHGCIEALNLALRAIAQPGDVIAVESPTFFGLLQILESLGLRALEIPTSPHTGISLEALDLAVQTYDNIKGVVIVPNLQNPLGSIMPDDHKQRLVLWCEAQDIPLVEDDTYSALADAQTPLSALKAWDRSGNVIHCASLHKVLAPGMRLGWISAGKWHVRVEMLKYAQSRPTEWLPQIAVAEFMASGSHDRHLRRLRTRLRQQREQVSETIAAFFPAGTRLSVPDGGLILWVEMPGKLSSETVFDLAMREGIRVAPGLMFSNSARFDHFLRIGCGTPYSPELDRSLRRLAAIVTQAGDRASADPLRPALRETVAS